MVENLVAIFRSDLGLQAFAVFVDKFDNVACLDADHVIVVVAIVEFEYLVATFKVMASDKTGCLKLGQDPIDSRKSDVVT